jgi:hypothetical protein
VLGPRQSLSWTPDRGHSKLPIRAHCLPQSLGLGARSTPIYCTASSTESATSRHSQTSLIATIGFGAHIQITAPVHSAAAASAKPGAAEKCDENRAASFDGIRPTGNFLFPAPKEGLLFQCRDGRQTIECGITDAALRDLISFHRIKKSASIEQCRFWASACHLLMYYSNAAANQNRTESHSQDATVQLPPKHELADLLATSTVAVDIKILYTDGCIRMPARRLVALRQAVKGRSV